MQTSTEARIADWETRSAVDGYAGLNALSESGFSGVITGSETALFMLSGRVVGLTDGSIERFETGSLTARIAPHPALPLLLSMQEQGGQTRATYYTNNTPIEEATATLEEGGFTGYIELSENVHSGDYFLVYHQGRSMCVAFVGSDDRLVTDDEAEARLHEEVGVYTVESVDVTEVAIPEPTTAPSKQSESMEDTEPTSDSDTPARPPETKDRPPEPDDETPIGPGNETPVEPEDDTPAKPNDERPNEAIEAPDETVETSNETVETPSEIIEATNEAAEPPDSDSVASDPESVSSDPSSSGPSSPDRSPSVRSDEPSDPQDRWGSVIEDPVEDRIAAEQQWRETNRIPSLDPDRSMVATGTGETGTTNTAGEAAPEPSEEVLSRALDALEAEREAREVAEESIVQLREEIEQLESQIVAAEAESTAEADSESVSESEPESSAETGVESPPGTGVESPSEIEPEPAPNRSLDPETALSGTNLFVRYASKGAATLEDAHAGDVDRKDLAENLRLERRTEFDSATAMVEGTPFETFLTDRLEYQFAEWIVGELPFELAETGHASSLGALYDALPAIDRIELQGTIEGDEERRRFDVVCRDRMGAPLFVVDCMDGRKATTEKGVATLVESATEIKQAAPDLAGAMIVTTSYFDPGALSTAAEATRSGLLGGGSRESFVTISRRNGYHLCLAEMHDGTFHVTVPEL